MEKYMKGAFFVLPLLVLASCAEDEIIKNSVEKLGKGDEVVFTFTESERSRTMYEDDWDPTSGKQGLVWGNYADDMKEEVKIFCKAGARQIASYSVDYNETEPSADATGLTRLGDYGVQWGAEGTTHNFFAFYPADKAGSAFLNNSDNTIRAEVTVAQSPKGYTGTDASGNSYSDLSKIQANTTQEETSATTIYGKPDMSGAIMVAATSVDATGYGQPVGLEFNVLADVLDINISGPVIPNTLGGNSTGTPRQYIRIRNVRIESTNNTVISGTFDLNMSTGEATNISGNTYIQLQTASVINGTTYFPQLNTRVDVGKGNAPSAAQVDHLRLRAFIIPGVVSNLDQLQIVVETDCGTYTQKLGDYAFGQSNGQIHRIKMPYFNQRGAEFDFSKWMAQLDPNIYISELSIPGTWHSAASIYQGNYNNISTQYQGGVRGFEMQVINQAQTSTSDKVYSAWTDGTSTVDVAYVAPPASVSNLTSTTISSTLQQNYNIKLDATNTNSGTATRTYTYTLPQTATITYTQESTPYLVNLAATDREVTASLTALGELIQPGEFCFVEMGMNTPQKNSYGSVTYNTPTSRTKTITKTQTATFSRTQTGNGNNRTYTYTFSNWTTLTEPTTAEWAAAPANDDEMPDEKSATTTGEMKTFEYSAASWAYAVNSVIEDYVKTASSKIYTDEITANTTLGDVSGKIVVKINTNDVDNQANETGWSQNFPALFSRWTAGSADSYATVALQWGQPIDRDDTNSALKWCFIEKESATLATKKTQVDNFITESILLYQQGKHNTWFECMIGGYDGSATAANALSLGTSMNEYLYTKITDPLRQACPLGVVLMNYALGNGTTNDAGEDTTYGPALVRTIINNNSAFILARKGASSAAENTNSSFSSSSNNSAIK